MPETPNPNHILGTGGSVFIHPNLVAVLETLGHDVRVLDSLPKGTTDEQSSRRFSSTRDRLLNP